MSELIGPRAELDLVLPYNLVLIPGAFHTGSTFDPLRDVLSPYVDEITAITFERTESEVTIESDVGQIVDAIGHKDNLVVVCWSRGVEPAIRLPQALDSEQFKGLVVCGSGGPQSFRLPLELETGTINPRYNGDYAKGMVQRKDGFLEYSPDFARQYIYNDLEEIEAQKAIAGMVAQPHYAPSRLIESWDKSLPSRLLLGQNDLAIDGARAQAVCRSFFMRQTWIIDKGSHAFHYSKPEILGQHILAFIREELGASGV